MMFAVAWGGNQFTPLLGMYRARAGYDDVTVTVLLFAYVIGLVPSLLGASSISQRVGRRTTLLVALALSIGGSVLVAAAPASPWCIGSGRLLTGLALGTGMVLGATWLHDAMPKAPDISTLRSAMSLTAGFAMGPAIAGALAQWAPLPTALPYVVHIAVCAAAGWLLLRGPEPVSLWESTSEHATASFPWAYLFLVAPAAPLIFASLGVSYAVVPPFVAEATEGWATAFSALLCLTSLGLGYVTQRALVRLPVDTVRRWAVPIGVTVICLGFALSALVLATGSAVLALAVGAGMGVGYGLVLAGCLLRARQLGTRRWLPLLTSITYSLAYLGFGVPMLLAWLDRVLAVGYGQSLIVLAVLSGVPATVGALAWRVLTRKSAS